MHRRLAARAILTAGYHDWRDLYIGSKGHRKCDRRGMEYLSGDCRQFMDCLVGRAMILQLQPWRVCSWLSAHTGVGDSHVGWAGIVGLPHVACGAVEPPPVDRS